jgi:hypothetical protein
MGGTIDDMRDEDVERYRGQWVAVDRLTEHVVAGAESIEELRGKLDRGPQTRVLIHRVPKIDDPLFIGLG